MFSSGPRKSAPGVSQDIAQALPRLTPFDQVALAKAPKRAPQGGRAKTATAADAGSAAFSNFGRQGLPEVRAFVAGLAPKDPVTRWATAQVGSHAYGLDDPSVESRGRVKSLLPAFARGWTDPKCNKFVWDALAAGGRPAGRIDGGRIPVASDWGNPEASIGGYSVVTEAPQPGDVVSDGKHVGIFAPLPDGSPGTVSAATPSLETLSLGEVVHNDWGFRGNQGPITVRRANREN